MTDFCKMSVLCLSLASPLAAQDVPDDEGGIIGTGIVGMVQTGGVWRVAGVAVDVADGTDVRSPLGPRDVAEVANGSVLALGVEPMGDRWAATNIRQIYPLVGQVEQVLETGVVIMGTVVTLTQIPKVDWPEGGAWVAVSGVWKSNGVAASVLEFVPPRQQSVVTGTIARDVAGDLRIGDTQILDLDPQEFADGDVVEVAGTWTVRGLIAEQVTAGPFALRPDVVRAQGFLSQPDESGFYTLLGTGGTAVAQNPAMINPDAQVIRCVYHGVLVDATTAVRVPQAADVLSRLGCDFP